MNPGVEPVSINCEEPRVEKTSARCTKLECIQKNKEFKEEYAEAAKAAKAKTGQSRKKKDTGMLDAKSDRLSECSLILQLSPIKRPQYRLLRPRKVAGKHPQPRSSSRMTHKSPILPMSGFFSA